MVHDLQLAQALNPGSPVREVRAVGVPVLSARVDLANVRLAFANGCVANLTASRVSSERVRKLRLFEPDAYYSIDYAEQSVSAYRLVRSGGEAAIAPIDVAGREGRAPGRRAPGLPARLPRRGRDVRRWRGRGGRAGDRRRGRGRDRTARRPLDSPTRASDIDSAEQAAGVRRTLQPRDPLQRFGRSFRQAETLPCRVSLCRPARLTARTGTVGGAEVDRIGLGPGSLATTSLGRPPCSNAAVRHFQRLQLVCSGILASLAAYAAGRRRAPLAGATGSAARRTTALGVRVPRRGQPRDDHARLPRHARRPRAASSRSASNRNACSPLTSSPT